MAHAETCPVCRGNGKIDNYKGTTCHGCNGRGWVEVGDTYPAPMVPIPSPSITIGPWVYESGTYSANVEVVIESI